MRRDAAIALLGNIDQIYMMFILTTIVLSITDNIEHSGASYGNLHLYTSENDHALVFSEYGAKVPLQRLDLKQAFGKMYNHNIHRGRAKRQATKGCGSNAVSYIFKRVLSITRTW